MTRWLTAWVSTIVLAVIGSQLAHALDYRLVSPHAHDREELLADTGHGYLGYAPLLVGLAISILLVSLAMEARRALRHVTVRACPWALALVAPALFAIQEHLERWFHDGAVPWSAVLDRTFVLGAILQVPFALGAYLLARLLLSIAHALGRLLGRPPSRRRARAIAFRTPYVVHPARRSVLGLGYGERGPPVIL